METQIRSRRRREMAKTLKTLVTNIRKRKLKELRQARGQRRRVILSSSSSSMASSFGSPSHSPIQTSTTSLNEREDNDVEVIEEPYDTISLDTITHDLLASGDGPLKNTEVPPATSEGAPAADNVPPDTTDVAPRTNDAPPATTEVLPAAAAPSLAAATEEVVPEPELDPGLLVALGNVPDDTAYGPNIHQELASRWLPILRKGVPKEAKQQLLKEYTIPGNCQLLKAPTLNAEISGVVSQGVRGRDKKIQTRQDQLGLGISVINRAMDLLLTSDDKVRAVKFLSDGCRILSDLHFVETQVRKKLITPGLDQNFLSIIERQVRDDTLFGDKLPEKIIAFKASLQIRRDTAQNASSTSSPSPSRRRPHRHRSASTRSASSSRGRAHRVGQEAACAAPAPPPAAGPAFHNVGSQQQNQDPSVTQGSPDPALSARAQRAARRSRTSRGPTAAQLDG